MIRIDVFTARYQLTPSQIRGDFYTLTNLVNNYKVTTYFLVFSSCAPLMIPGTRKRAPFRIHYSFSGCRHFCKGAGFFFQAWNVFGREASFLISSHRLDILGPSQDGSIWMFSLFSGIASPVSAVEKLERFTLLGLLATAHRTSLLKLTEKDSIKTQNGEKADS